jgi:hypothetical protein
MWPGIIEVRLVLFHHPVQVSLAQDEVEIQALTAHTAQKAFADGVRSRCSIRGPQYLDPLSDPRKGWTVLAVVVADEVSWSFRKGCCFSQLLGDPGIGWVSGHAEMDEASRAELDDDEQEE